MADEKISAMPSAAPVGSADVVTVVQGGVNKQSSVTGLASGLLPFIVAGPAVLCAANAGAGAFLIDGSGEPTMRDSFATTSIGFSGGFAMIGTGLVKVPGLPGADPGVPGQLYQVAGQVFVSL